MVNKLGCIVGRHKWQYHEPEYGSATEERLGLARKPPTRLCTKCGKEQVGEINCLGLNPPEYNVCWRNK